MSDVKNHDDLYVVVISTKEERNQLHDLCVKYNVPIIYPDLFKEKKVHRLWGISQSGIGLIGTVIARNTAKDHIIYSLDKLEKIIREFDEKGGLHVRKDL